MKYILMMLISLDVFSMSYDDIDVGDRYYINNFGYAENNDYVKVVRKLGNNKIKVKNLNTYETDIVYASKLLTKDELSNAETKNTIGGILLIGCLLSENCLDN